MELVLVFVFVFPLSALLSALLHSAFRVSPICTSYPRPSQRRNYRYVYIGMNGKSDADQSQQLSRLISTIIEIDLDNYRD